MELTFNDFLCLLFRSVNLRGTFGPPCEKQVVFILAPIIDAKDAYMKNKKKQRYRWDKTKHLKKQTILMSSSKLIFPHDVKLLETIVKLSFCAILKSKIVKTETFRNFKNEMNSLEVSFRINITERIIELIYLIFLNVLNFLP